MHVYGFTGQCSAELVRLGAIEVLESFREISPARGSNFFKHSEFPQLSIELFPKQDSLEGKDLGNLMRLPCGRNLKGGSAFFVDLRSRITEITERDPIKALTTDDPWAGYL